MKKWLLALFTALCVGTCAIGLVACGENDSGNENPPIPTTEHHFSTEWESDGAHHWHVCTDHTDCGQRSGYASHDFGDDNECDICHYVKPIVHEHTWVTKYDENNHWLQTDCGEEHALEKKEPEAHVFDGDGVCTNKDCGVKEIETQVYAIYKSYTEGLGDESPLGFAEWKADLAAKGVVSVSINDMGDGVLHYAPEGDAEEGAEEVAYFIPRTVKVNAKNGSSPVVAFWVKLSVTKGGTTTVLDLAKPDDGKLYAELTFTPVGYSGDGISYTISLPDKDELPSGGIVEEEPYPAEFLVTSAESFSLTVDGTPFEGDYVATYEMVEALSTEHDYTVSALTYSASNYTTIPVKNVEPGGYKVSFTKVSGFEKWKQARDKYEQPRSRIGVVAMICAANQRIQGSSYSTWCILDHEDDETMYGYLYWPASQLAYPDKHATEIYVSTTYASGVSYSFSVHLEKYEAPVAKDDGTPMNVGVMPNMPKDPEPPYLLGLDVSKLVPGSDYVMKLDVPDGVNNDATPPLSMNYAFDDGALHSDGGGKQFLVTIPEKGAKMLYLYGTGAGGSTIYSAMAAKLQLWKVNELTSQTAEVTPNITNGNAYYKYPLADGSNSYLFSLTATSTLGGVSLAAGSTNTQYGTPVLSTGSSVIASKRLSGDYTHASDIATYSKTAAAPFKILCLSAADTVPTGLKLKISKQDATPTSFNAGTKTTVTFSEANPVQTFTCHVTKGTYVLSAKSASDIAGFSVKQGTSNTISVLSSGSRTSASAVITVTEEKDLTFTMNHVGSGYPAVDFTLYSSSGAKALTDNTADTHTFNSTDAVQYYTFTPTEGGVHVLDISGTGANKVTVYRSEEGSTSALSAIITASDEAKDYASWTSTSLTLNKVQTFIFVFSGDSAELKITMHSQKGAKAITENVGESAEFSATNRFGYYTFTVKTAGMHSFELVTSGDGVLTDFQVFRSTSDYASGSSLEGKKAYAAAAVSGLTAVDDAVTFLVWYKGSGNVSATLTIHSPKDATVLTDNVAAADTNFGSSLHVKYFTFQATETGTHILELSAPEGKSLKGFKLYQDTTTSAKLNVTTESTYQQHILSLDPEAANGGKVTFILVYEGDGVNVSLILHSAKSAETIGADTDVKVDFAKDKTHIKYYTYTATVAGTYYLEVIGNSVAGYALYSDSSTSALFTSATAKFNVASWFTVAADDAGSVNKKASFALVYSGTEAEAPITLKLHTPSGATEKTVGTAFDVSFSEEATSWHVQYVKFTPSATAVYHVTVSVSGDATLGGIAVYASGNTTAILSKTTLSDSSVSATGKVDGTASTPVTLIYYYKGTATVKFQSCIHVEKEAAAADFTKATSLTLGVTADSRVKYFTITPAYDIQATLYLKPAEGVEKANLARIGVDWLEDGVYADCAFSVNTTSTTETASLNKVMSLKKGVKYTFCVYWTGTAEITVNFNFTESMKTPTVNYTTGSNSSFGNNYLYWSPVYGATQYLVQKQVVGDGGETSWETVETIDASKPSLYSNYVAFELKETKAYNYVMRVVAQRLEGAEVKASTTSSTKTMSVKSDIRKVKIVITMPDNFPGIKNWQVWVNCYDSKNSKVTAGSTTRTITIPANEKEVSFTAYTAPNYSTDDYLYGLDHNSGTLFTTGGWDIDTTQRVKVDADGNTTITYHLLQPAKYNITVKAPKGYVNDSVKVSLLRGTITKGSATVSFDGTGEGEQTKTVTIDAPVGKYNVQVALPACDALVDDTVTVQTTDEQLTGTAEVAIKEQAAHTVTLNLPANWVGDAELSVGLFLEEGTSAILTEKVTPAASATTATVSFKAAYGRNYVAKLTAGLPEGYSLKDEKTAVMNSATAEAGATGSIAVNQRAKYTVTVNHSVKYTQNSLTVQLWAPDAKAATYSKSLTVDKEKGEASVDFYAPIGTYEVKLSSLAQGGWSYNTETPIKLTTTDSNLEASTEINLIVPYMVTLKVKVPEEYAKSCARYNMYFKIVSVATGKLVSGTYTQSTVVSTSKLEYDITITIPVSSENDEVYITYKPQQSKEKEWVSNRLKLNAKNGDSGTLEFVRRDTAITVEVTYPEGYPLEQGGSVHWEITEDPSGKCLNGFGDETIMTIASTYKSTYTFNVPKGVTIKVTADCGRDGSYVGRYYLADGYVSSSATATVTESGKTVLQITVTAAPAADA